MYVANNIYFTGSEVFASSRYGILFQRLARPAILVLLSFSILIFRFLVFALVFFFFFFFLLHLLTPSSRIPSAGHCPYFIKWSELTKATVTERKNKPEMMIPFLEHLTTQSGS